ncbi:MAG: hypothetical protein QOI12_484 [Alphaproteobacteria bacterium]|jgi:hypothetical protein|nr:hypothetical protein [Alphaproteobacteria bacterium]
MVDFTHPISVRAQEHAGRSITASLWRFFTRAGCNKTVDFTNRQIATLFVVLAAMTSIPIVLHPFPPLADYINHLSRMHIIATIGSDPDLARFYQVDWQIIPNLMMDLVVPAFERIMNIYLAGQIYTIASFMLIISGALMLNRRLFGHWSILPLIAFPLLYNNVFLVGTMNYVFGMGLSLWALAVWVWLRERHVLIRLAVSTLFVVALFFCHLFAVGLYGLGLLAFELHRLGQIYSHRARPLLADFIGNRPRSPLFDFVACGLPFAPVLPLLMLSPTWGLRASFVWEFLGKIDGLMYVIEVYSHFAAFVLTGIVAFAAGWGMRHRALQFHSFGWVLLAVGTITYVAMPRVIFDTFMADQRLPISLAFMVIACAHLSLRRDYVRRGFVAVLVLLLAIRVFEVQFVWADLSRATTSFHDSVRLIERGSKVLVAYADADAGDDVKDLGLVHAACIAIIERSALVTTAFTVVGKQILHVRDGYSARVDKDDGTPPSVNQLIQVADRPEAGIANYWGKWTSDYDYIYVLFTDADFENPDPARLTPIYAGERFALFRINSSHIADISEPLPPE